MFLVVEALQSSCRVIDVIDGVDWKFWCCVHDQHQVLRLIGENVGFLVVGLSDGVWVGFDVSWLSVGDGVIGEME